MSNIDQKFKLPSRHQNTKRFWLEYESLIADFHAVDLGQGYPDYVPLNFLTKTLEEVATSKNSLLHQYTRDYGHPRLVEILAKLYSHLLRREIDPRTEILTTVGAQEAICSSILGHIDVMDEVIIIEPFFDAYEPMVKTAGGVVRFVPLKLKEHFSGEIPTSKDWVMDREELGGLFNSKTKMLILNNPLNSLGKVYQKEELQFIADLCIKWNVLCLSDEVYEWIVYKPNKHIRMATLSGMWDRTITIGSAGKTFGVTGWKLGWAYGPANLLYNLEMVHQNSVYTGNTPIQEVVAITLEKEFLKLDQENCYFKKLSSDLEDKRNFMVELLTEIGFKPTIPEGGYFIMADCSTLDVNLSTENDEYEDYRFTKWLMKHVGILGIPLTPFYGNDHKTSYQNFTRFCFFKKDETLQKAAELFKKWKSK